MRIEVIAIGTELLTTRRQDTNSIWLAERLADLGLALHRKGCVGDDREDLRTAFLEAAGRSDLVICTGGLGPTFDDQTKEVWAEVLGAPLVEDPASWEAIRVFYSVRGRVPPEANRKQAMIPLGATVLPNPVGTAPGVLFEDPPGHPGLRVALLPGPPPEMTRMFLDHLEPRLKGVGRPTLTLRVVVAGVPESLLEERSRPLRERHAHLDWTILAGPVQVEFLARSADAAALEAAHGDLRDMLGPDYVCRGDGSLEGALLALLEARGETLALAESMTGGLAGARLTAVPGASRVLLGGAVVYSPAAKSSMAGLDDAFLAEHGTVSEATTLALAHGIRGKLGATWGLAVTGNAGPDRDPGGQDVPVGSGFIAWAGPGGEGTDPFRWPGERPELQVRAAAWALDHLRRALLLAPRSG